MGDIAHGLQSAAITAGKENPATGSYSPDPGYQYPTGGQSGVFEAYPGSTGVAAGISVTEILVNSTTSFPFYQEYPGRVQLNPGNMQL